VPNAERDRDARGRLGEGITEVPVLIQAMRWNEAYQLFEDTMDTAEQVATVSSTIAIKNA
jgi:hypothetical protein